MALATYADLKTNIPLWAERQDLTALVPLFIVYAEQEIGRRLRASVNLSTADVSITGEFVAVPATFRALKRLYLDTTPRRPLTVVSAEMRADVTAQFASSTYPTCVSVEGSEFGFGPVPTGTTTAKALFYAQPAALSADTDTNDILARYPFLYLYGALSELYRYIEDDAHAQQYESRFQAMIDAVNLSESTDAMSGPVQGQPAFGGII